MNAHPPLGSAARRRGLITLLIDNFFMYGGFFMVIPLLSVHYVDDLGWAAASIGLILGVRQLMQQGLSLVGGALADRLGAKGLICTGLLIRAFGLGCMAWASSFPLLLLAAVLAALGGVLFDAPLSAAVAALTDEANRGRFYSLVGAISGLGMTIGPLVGSLLLRTNFALVALAAGGCFLVTALVSLLFLPPVHVADDGQKLTYGVGLAMHDRPFMIFTILLMGYWFMWVQLSISLPLIAKTVSGTTDSVSWLYGLNAGMSVLFQYPLLRLAERWMRPLQIVVCGLVLMAIGLGSIALASSVPTLLLCVALFSAGALLTQPSQQMVTAGLSNPASFGSYFGVNALALALGGGLGNYGGGLLYGLALQLKTPALPWLIFGFVGMGAACGMALLHRHLTARMSQHKPALAVGGR
jgi:DHA1 family multidrug resistance protein-like MFS transporter